MEYSPFTNKKGNQIYLDKLRFANILSIEENNIEEGYKVYNADGKLLEQHEDAAVPPQQYNDVLKSFCDGECCLYSLKKENGRYVFEIDASNERTYLLCVAGTRDVEEWERFLSKE